MRCHYVYDEQLGKFLMPGCMSVAVTNDIESCTCMPETYEGFEKERYNEVLNKKNEEIKELKALYFSMQRLLKRKIKGFSKKKFEKNYKPHQPKKGESKTIIRKIYEKDQ